MRPVTEHSSLVMFLTKTIIVSLLYPTYSLDLAPVDFHLFSSLTMQLNGRRFNTVGESELQKVLYPLTKNGFQAGFHKWQGRWDRCIAM